jgi:glycine cleavage system regulatory protein
MGAEPIFLAQADIVLPSSLGLDDLRDTLEQIATDIMVDIELTDA